MEVAWGSLLSALTAVERLAPRDSGVLSFGEARRGGIFVEDRRICWSAAQGLEGRLRGLLRPERSAFDASAPLAPASLPPPAFERALRRHSAESLLELCGSAEPTAWRARTGRSFAPRFSLTPLDALFDAVDVALPGLRGSATAELTPLLGPGRRGASFHALVDAFVPVAASDACASVEFLTQLGRWATTVPRASRELEASPFLALATTDSGEVVSVWWRDSLLHVVVCDDLASVTAVTAHHLARG